jgi:hypothetical protein
MNSELLTEIRKRADRLDNDPNATRFAYPVNGASVAMAVPDGFEGGDTMSAVWTITDSETDRDGDRVFSIDTTDWEACGCPVLYGHGQLPVPIGSAAIPGSNPPKADLWEENGVIKARVYFHKDPTSQLIANKANCLGASIAFVPVRFARRDGSDMKAHDPGYNQQRSAFDWYEVSLTELSLTPTPSNARAVRDLAYAKGCPDVVRKHISKVCESGRCLTSMIPDLPIHLAPEQARALKKEFDALRLDVCRWEFGEICQAVKALVQADVETNNSAVLNSEEDEEEKFQTDGTGPDADGMQTGERGQVNAGDVPEEKCPCGGSRKCQTCQTKGYREMTVPGGGWHRVTCYQCKGTKICQRCKFKDHRSEIVNRFEVTPAEAEIPDDAETGDDDEQDYDEMRQQYSLPPSQLT